MIRRGDVYYTNLPPVGEHVQCGVRPVVIVSNNVGNRFAGICVVAPITSKSKRKIPTHFDIDLDKKSTVLCEQLRVVHKSQLYDKVYTLSESEVEQLDKALTISLGIRTEAKANEEQ